MTDLAAIAPALAPAGRAGPPARRAVAVLVGVLWLLAGFGVWGSVLFAALTGTLEARIGGAEAVAASAKREAAQLLAARAAERRQSTQSEAARIAAQVAASEGEAEAGPRLADVVGEADGPNARKEAFIGIVLPLILAENERLSGERARLLRLRGQADAALGPDDLVWLRAMAADYDVDDPGATAAEMIDDLLPRVDIVPPSLALGQAAEESGWGTSRPAQGQNALFGLQTINIGGVVSAPVAARDGRLKNASFEHLRQCVTVYMHNLNTNRAYAAFRDARAERRRAARPLDGVALMAHLTRYSELGMDYIRKVQALIKRNRLDALDRVPRAGSVPR